MHPRLPTARNVFIKLTISVASGVIICTFPIETSCDFRSVWRNMNSMNRLSSDDKGWPITKRSPICSFEDNEYKKKINYEETQSMGNLRATVVILQQYSGSFFEVNFISDLQIRCKSFSVLENIIAAIND